MTTPLSPREVWEKQHEYVRNFDAAGQAALFAEDGVWELPLAKDPIPRRLEGRAAILAFAQVGMEHARNSGRKIIGYENVTIHQTSNPEVIVAEFTLRGRTADSQEYTTPYVQVLRVRGGLIMSLRDYFILPA